MLRREKGIGMKRGYQLYLTIFIATILLLTVGVGMVDAQTREPTDDEVNAVARELYCPVCENVPLDVCPTQACQQWRATIKEKLTDGWNEDQIKQYFVDQYGARVLATPPAEGFSVLVYILPPLAFAAGVFILYRAFKTWRRDADEFVPAPVSDDDPYVAQMEEELRRRDS
jgi:cytochrome c-type biogenesis protein CcmH